MTERTESLIRKREHAHAPNPFRCFCVCRRNYRQHCANEHSPPHFELSFCSPAPPYHSSRGMSASGQKRKCGRFQDHVCFTPQSRHRRSLVRRRGHMETLWGYPVSRNVRSRSALCKFASTTALQRRTSPILLLKRGLPAPKFQRAEPPRAPVCYRDGTKTSA
jgi:hypothetical protein